jgi:hypothetical protein
MRTSSSSPFFSSSAACFLTANLAGGAFLG